MIDIVFDISHHNPTVDFVSAAQAGMVGVVHKATEGLTNTDLLYAGRKSEALAAGLLWGAYHFGHNDDGAAQAKYFLGVVQPGPTDLLVLDFESNAGMTTGQAEAFVQYVYQQTGRYPGLYTSTGYLQQQGATTSHSLHKCWLWLAEYNSVISAPKCPPGWPNPWTMWQYTETGGVPGVIGNCDRDRFNGTADRLRLLWGAPVVTVADPVLKA
ncbi:glycoside hydrolase family 25 protein [Hymenobacter chitinivorans]|uniref:Lysozyme n=1 Tax=Hymenobacter chitinivorans DSM 11115 TaxID=1121954 RepID=A0A2M9B5H5_9BACT|nr:glycoside hydrolase family 25 protein [Hymenobacter chitinivorans]PJJ53190.1 lysozyme [Hymenobacter chitinivorans DSM 11115]